MRDSAARALESNSDLRPRYRNAPGRDIFAALARRGTGKWTLDHSGIPYKDNEERQVAITTRLALELERLKASAPDNADGLVFGIIDNVKRSFTAARSKAGLKDVRFHDLRHTAATRLVGAHIPLSEVGRVLGHTRANTTYRYVNANIDSDERQQPWTHLTPKQHCNRSRSRW